MFERLPTDVLCFMSEFLDERDWLNFRQICKHTRNIQDKTRSKRLLQQLKSTAWRKTYKVCVRLAKRIKLESNFKQKRDFNTLLVTIVYEQWIEELPNSNDMNTLRNLIINQPCDTSRILYDSFQCVYKYSL